MSNNKSIEFEELPEFKAQPKHYRSFVNIITGYNCLDNPYIGQTYVRMLQSQPEENKNKLMGVWKKNELK